MARIFRMIRCPLCGKMGKFNKVDFSYGQPLEIARVYWKRSLGRGRGFEVVKQKVLSDLLDKREYRNKAFEILDFSVGLINAFVLDEEFKEKIRKFSPFSDRLDELEATVDELVQDRRDLDIVLQRKEERIRELESKLGDYDRVLEEKERRIRELEAKLGDYSRLIENLRRER